MNEPKKMELTLIDRVNPTAMAPNEKQTLPKNMLSVVQVKPVVLSTSPMLPRTGELRRANFETNPYDLTEIVRASETEAYITKSFLEHTQLIVREGFAIKSQDQDVQRYINRRIKEIEILSARSFNLTIRQAVRDLVRTCNAYIVFSRRNYPTSGRQYRWNGLTLNPIVGIFNANPESVTVLRDHRGRPHFYRQRIYSTGLERIWPARDVIHLTYNRHTGDAYGTPWVVPALDDVRLLRRFEEYVDILGKNYSQPFIHWRVGTDDQPASVDPDTGESEVSRIKREVQQMAEDAMAITTHRHEISAVETAKSGVPLEPLLKYLKERTMASLNLSSITLGEGGTANRATASQLVQVGINRCKDMQEVIADTLNASLLLELYLDSGRPFDMNAQPYIEFAEIDVEQQRSRETHALQMFQGGLITHAEARAEMNRSEFTEADRSDDIITWEGRKLESELELEKKLSLDPQLQTQKQVASSRAATAKKASGAPKSNGSKAATKNRSQPQNQYGRKSTKTKVKKNDAQKRLAVESFLLESMLETHRSQGLEPNQFRKTLDQHLDKSLIIVHDFLRSAIHGYCDMVGRERLTGREIDSLVAESVRTHLGGRFSDSARALLDLPHYENIDEILGYIRDMDGQIQQVIELIAEKLDPVERLIQVGENASDD